MAENKAQNPQSSHSAPSGEGEVQQMMGMLNGLLQPWHASIQHPAQAQEQVLAGLLKIYAQTKYGAEHGAAEIGDIVGYRRAFPVANYEGYRPARSTCC